MTPSLRELAVAVGLDVNRTVGGGHASIELLRRRSSSRGWLDASAHGLLIAVSRLTPGTNVLAYCVLLGWRFHRTAGAAAALAAASVPGSLVVFGLTVTLVRVDRYPAVQAVLAIGILAAAVLVLASAWNLIRPYIASEAEPQIDERVPVDASRFGSASLEAVPACPASGRARRLEARSENLRRLQGILAFKTSSRRGMALIITAVAAGLIVLGATPVRTLLVAALVGFLLPLPNARR